MAASDSFSSNPLNVSKNILSKPSIEYASIAWQHSQPYASKFEDVYFSTEADAPLQGLAETEYVFLTHNQLSTRWGALDEASTSHFTIIETGFGSGLNFLATVDLWLKTAPAKAQLHYIAFEKYPFTRQDLARAHAHWPMFSDISLALLQQYHSLHPGFVHLPLANHRVHLTLAIGDVADWLPKLNAHADAWFLDGFAPAKNPDMWQPWLFEAMAKNAKPNATFATFTSASAVRKGLIAAGFHVEKASGYGKKREMLYGHYALKQVDQQSKPHSSRKPFRQTHIAVIGGGIAGCASAYHLSKLGFKVTLLEQSAGLAQGASGNPRGVIYPRLTGQADKSDVFAWQSLAYSLREYSVLSPQAISNCGVMQLAFNTREHARLLQVWQSYKDDEALAWLTAEQATDIAGIRVDSPALYFKQCGWVVPPDLCQAYIAQSYSTQSGHIDVRLSCQVIKLEQSAQGWQIETIPIKTAAKDVLNVDAVVIANAYSALQLPQTSHLPLQAVRGQMSVVAEDSASTALNTILCADGYMTPASASLGHAHAIGATFHPQQTDVSIRQEDNQANLNMAATLSPDLANWGIDPNSGIELSAVKDARASLRCVSHDYLPLVGALADAAQLRATLPKHASQPYQPPMYPHLYVNLGHGSKGMSTAPFCGALLARQIANDFGHPLPFLTEVSLQQALNPNRYLYKKLGLKRLLDDKASLNQV